MAKARYSSRGGATYGIKLTTLSGFGEYILKKNVSAKEPLLLNSSLSNSMKFGKTKVESLIIFPFLK